LAQTEVDKKENEIVVTPKIVSQLVLYGAIIVADTMQTQKVFSNQVVEAGADFVWTVKDNQFRTRVGQLRNYLFTKYVTSKRGLPSPTISRWA
jgi:predicted transposase YbfD/YdcC